MIISPWGKYSTVASRHISVQIKSVGAHERIRQEIENVTSFLLLSVYYYSLAFLCHTCSHTLPRFSLLHMDILYIFARILYVMF
jgi:hypothetical protein